MHFQNLIITCYMYSTNKADIQKEFNIRLENLLSVKCKEKNACVLKLFFISNYYRTQGNLVSQNCFLYQ